MKSLIKIKNVLLKIKIMSQWSTRKINCVQISLVVHYTCLDQRYPIIKKFSLPQLWQMNNPIHHLLVTLNQGCTTYGPRAKCGPQKILISPPKVYNFVCYASFFDQNTLWMHKNTSHLALGYAPRMFFARHDIWVVNPWS